ncbi:MAG: hypothetical protein AAF657_10940 [Acidobacteriota bacterium]
MSRSKLLAVLVLLILPVQAYGDPGDKESAWDALVRDDPSIVHDKSITLEERTMLESMTIEEASDFVAGVPSRATSGSNVFDGTNALGSLTTGQHNVAIGVDAMATLTTGTSNTAVGRSSLRYTNGFRNTAIGQTAMRDHTSGGNNVAVGDNALRQSLTGTSNTAVGAQAMRANMSHNNTAIGGLALRSSTTGFNNIALGFRAGFALTTGSNNILIGHEGMAADVGVTRIGTDGIHRFAYISGIYDVTPSGSTETVIIDSDGQLGSRETTSTVVTCAGGASPVTCSCPSGVIVGGGGVCSAGTHVLDASFPSSATSWEVSCVETSPGGLTPVTSAYAVCIP